ncbi:MAG: ComF family protein [Pseudomonadota bacterium]
MFSYEGAGRKLILALKHGDRSDLAPILGGWAMRAARDLVDGAEIIAPIPLHWTRRLKRRRNQSADIARWLAGKAGPRAKYMPRLLQRTRQTSSQDGKDRAARVANVQGAMKLARPTDVARKRVLIVDDVMTTGATLNEAARLCRDAGAADVCILVLALVIRDDSYYMPDLTEDEAHETG